ncbi:hypothetical protein ACQJBY_002450 [Aegilops geniculata]
MAATSPASSPHQCLHRRPEPEAHGLPTRCRLPRHRRSRLVHNQDISMQEYLRQYKMESNASQIVVWFILDKLTLSM